MHGNESAENYLETILVLSRRSPRSTVRRHCDRAGFQKVQCQRRHEKVKRKRPYYRFSGRIYHTYRIREGNCRLHL